MSYYRNAAGNVAKVLLTAGRVVVMVGYKTLFFTDSDSARLFLGSRGYY